MDIKLSNIGVDHEFENWCRDFEVSETGSDNDFHKMGRLVLLHVGSEKPKIVIATYEDCEEFDQVLRPYKTYPEDQIVDALTKLNDDTKARSILEQAFARS